MAKAFPRCACKTTTCSTFQLQHACLLACEVHACMRSACVHAKSMQSACKAQYLAIPNSLEIRAENEAHHQSSDLG